MSTLGKVDIARRPGCPSCGAILSPPAVGEYFRCPHCHQQLRIPAEGHSLETLPCVACSGRLLAYAGAHGQLVIDFCSSCEGFWFDGEELRKLVTRPELVDTFPLPPRGQKPPPMLSSRARSCPRCEGQPLHQMALGDVVVDSCPGCRGSWLDAGELERLSQLHHSRPDPEKKPEAPGGTAEPRSWLAALVGRALKLLDPRL